MSCYCFYRKRLCARDSLPLVFKGGAIVSRRESRAASGRQLLQKLEMITKFDKDSKFEFRKLNSNLAH